MKLTTQKNVFILVWGHTRETNTNFRELIVTCFTKHVGRDNARVGFNGQYLPFCPPINAPDKKKQLKLISNHFQPNIFIMQSTTSLQSLHSFSCSCLKGPATELSNLYNYHLLLKILRKVNNAKIHTHFFFHFMLKNVSRKILFI